MRSVRRDASRNRSLLVAAARAAMLEGVALPLDEVAARAGVGTATLYRHFASREVLEREVYRTVLREEVEPILALIDRDDPRGSFVEVSLRLIATFEQYRRPGAATLDLPSLLDDVFDELSAPFAELMREGQGRGEIRPDVDVHDTLWLFQIMVTAFSVPSATAQVRRRYLSLLFDALAPAEHGDLPPLD